ncbi:MAG: hypothetical protein KC620_07050 [Myxococcales bacterium]|nr:hypothetical protein [Myxococcales bacterium]
MLADALAEAPAADFRPRPRAPRRGEAGSLVVPAARAANDLEALGPGALRQGTASGPPPELRPPPTGVGLLDPEVRQAVERMASLLNASRPADAPLEAPTEDDEREDPFLGAEPTDMQGFDTPAIDHETVAADDLPLMGPTAFGVRLAAEVGRSGVRRKFTRLLAQLGDHLEPKDTNE